MNTIEFINHLRKLDINLFLEGERLRCKAPEGILTPTLKSEISDRKAELISFLQQANLQAKITVIAPISRTENNTFPLSFAQERLWFLYELQPNIPFYNIPLNLHFSGQIDIAALESSLQLLIARHEILRTNFITVDGKPAQVINATRDFTLPIIDLRSLSASQRDLECQKLASLAISYVFNLAEDSLIRAELVLLTPTENILLLTIHHIIFDGWSVNIFIHELTTIYAALVEQGKPHLPEINLQYVDFAVWQKQWLQGEVLESQLAYWQQKLTGMPALLELPIDHPRPAIQSFRGETLFFTIEPDISEALVNLSQQQGVTLFILLLTAFKVLLYRYTNQPDIVVGSPSANRQNLQTQGMIGFFVNNLVLRTNLSNNPTFLELLQQVKKVVLEAYDHQDLPFNKLVEALHQEGNLSYSPLFQIVFTLEHEPASNIILKDLTINTSDPGVNQTAKLDLSLSLYKTEQGLVGEFEYSTDLFKATTITRMIEHWQTLLAGIVANPEQRLSDLPILTAIEQHKLLVEWNQTQQDYPNNLCIHQLFEAQVEQTPDAVAVIFKDEQLTYRELNTKANQLANYLHRLGVKSETLVGICVERSFYMIVGILGILKAGGAYVPIDPAYPSERIAYMLDDSQIPVLLTQEKLVASLPEHQAQVICLDSHWEEISTESDLSPITDVMPENLAYVIYTSGSTGKPKGVLITHRGLCNLAIAQIKLFGIQHFSRVLQLVSLSFDVSIGEIATTLCAGATLCLGTRDELQPGQPLLELLQKQKITHISITPSALAALPTQELQALQTIIVGGEPCPPSLIASWASGRRFFNAYGPTESTVCATVAQYLEGMDVLPIGRPIDNTQIYILDRYLQPVPIGVPGELHIASIGLARGYLNRPDLTQEKFISNPFSNQPSSRLYKTGDKARYLPDGNIEFLGRIDNQVKIRGFRIELGEIEAALSQHPDVREVVVIIREDIPSNKSLVAYVVSNLIPERIPYNSECQLELDSNTITVHTEDISIGGVGLVEVPVLDENSSVRLHLQLPGEDEPRWLSGTVVWSHPPQAGIRFHLTPSEQAQVDQSVAYQLDNQQLWKILQPTVTRNLRDYLKQKLPDYMIPSAFVLMKALPLTPNGKIDRHALKAPEKQSKIERYYVAPRTPIEEILANIWSQVLKVEMVGVYDNFFELGGHSLKATQVMSQLREAFKIDLPLRELFEGPTVAELAATIASRIQKPATIGTYTQHNLNAEAVLDPTIQPQNLSFTYTSEPQRIFLTGATGFLGAYLLYELLEQTQANVYCLVRYTNEELAFQKLQNQMKSYKIWKEDFRARIVPVIGDLSKRLIGFSGSQFVNLAETIDIVYHNGAWVNAIYPYSTLKPVNVLGTQEVLRFASEIKVKSVHYISTLSVFDSPYYSDKIVLESDPLDYSENIDSGYAESKWVAEKLVMLARDRGLPISIYRPARILGHSQTGICNPDDFWSQFILGCIELGMVPKFADWKDNIIPVDYMSRAIVHLSRQRESLGKAFHLLNPNFTPMDELFNWIRDLGYPLEEVPYGDWRAYLMQVIQISSNKVLESLVHVLSENEEEKNINFPDFRFTNTLSGLAGTDIIFPAIDQGLIEKYFSDFKNRDLLPKKRI